MAQDNLRTRGGVLASDASEGVTYTPRVDVCENREEYVLFCDLPGTKVDDIQLRFHQGELHLQGKVTPRQKNVSLWLNEYGMGDFYRTFRLPSEVDDNKINAEYKLGVLTVHIPKKEASKPKQIAIQAT